MDASEMADEPEFKKLKPLAAAAATAAPAAAAVLPQPLPPAPAPATSTAAATATGKRVLPASLLPPHLVPVSSLPPPLPPLELPKGLRWHLAETPEQCTEVSRRVLALSHQAGLTVWGFDIEWFVSYELGKQRPVALIQLHRQLDVVMFHVSRCGVCPELVEILSSPTIIKVGLSISGDKAKLERDFVACRQSALRGFVDLRHLQDRAGSVAARVGGGAVAGAGAVTGAVTGALTAGPSGRGLADMVKDRLGRTLTKPESLRRGNWELTLTDAMRRYAALDAYAASALFESLLAQIRARPDGAGVDVPGLLTEIALLPAAPLPVVAGPGNRAATSSSLGSAAAPVVAAEVDENRRTCTISRVTLLDGVLSAAWGAATMAVSDMASISLPSRISSHLDQFSQCIMRTSVLPQQRVAYAKTSALEQFMASRGKLSIEQLARQRSVKDSTFAAYLIEGLQAALPYVFAFFNISVQERDAIVVTCLCHAADAAAAGVAGTTGTTGTVVAAAAESSAFKSRRHLYEITQLAQKYRAQSVFSSAGGSGGGGAAEGEAEVWPPYWKVQAVDTHLSIVFGQRNWESVFVPGLR